MVAVYEKACSILILRTMLAFACSLGCYTFLCYDIFISVNGSYSPCYKPTQNHYSSLEQNPIQPPHWTQAPMLQHHNTGLSCKQRVMETDARIEKSFKNNVVSNAHARSHMRTREDTLLTSIYHPSLTKSLTQYASCLHFLSFAAGHCGCCIEIST